MFDDVSFLRFLSTFEEYILGRGARRLALGFFNSLGLVRVSSEHCEEAENKSSPSLSRS